MLPAVSIMLALTLLTAAKKKKKNASTKIATSSKIVSSKIAASI